MVNRLVSGGGAGRLLDEVGEGPGWGDHRPAARGKPRVSARTTSTCTGCTTPASTHTDRRNHRHTERPRARREDPLHRTLGHPRLGRRQSRSDRGLPQLATHQFQPPHIPAPSSGPAAPFASRAQTVAVGIGPQKATFVTLSDRPAGGASARSRLICRRLGRLVFHSYGAPYRRFCRGDESARAIKILTRCVRLVLRCGLARPAAGQLDQQAAPLVAVPDRDGECRARGAYCRAHHANMHAGQELLALGSARENPADGFPPKVYLVPLLARCCLRAPKCRLRYVLLVGRSGSGLTAPGDAAAQGDLAIPPSGPGSPAYA